jgi:hypothetical protein
MQHSAQCLYARDLEDPDVPDFVKQNGDSYDNDFDESGDYETDEEYEISTRVGGDGKLRKVAIPTMNQMNRSVSNVGKMLQESFNASKRQDNSTNFDSDLMSMMKQLQDRPKQERTLLVSMFQLMNGIPAEQRDRFLAQFANQGSKHQKSQTSNLIHQKYRLSGKSIKNISFF